MENTVRNFYNKISLRYKYAFFSGIIFGLCAHLYQFTNKLPNYDEYGQTPAGLATTTELGRWGLDVLGFITGRLSGWFSLPMVNGLVTLVGVVLSACLIIYCFDIKDCFICGMIGAVCAVYPTVMSTLFFMFTAPYYSVSLFVSCLAAIIWIRSLKADISLFKKVIWGIVAMVLAVFGIGIYQAYAPVYMTMLLISCIIDCLEDKDELKTILIRGVVYMAEIALAFIIYLMVTEAVSQLTQIPISDYRGFDTIGDVTIGGLFFGVIRSYDVYRALLMGKDVLQINPGIIVKTTYVILFVFTIILVVLNYKNKEKSLYSRVLVIIGTIMMPVSIFFIFVMVTDGSVYTLMIFSGVFLFIYPLTLFDRIFGEITEEKSKKLANVFSWVTASAISLSVLLFIWFANGNYQGLQYTHYHDMSYFQTITTQIKSLDGYREDLPVALIGNFDDDTAKAGSLMQYYFNAGGKSETNVNYKSRVLIWKCYLGFTPELIEDKLELEKILNKDAVKAMPTYPEAGSIAIVDDVVIVKAGESVH